MIQPASEDKQPLIVFEEMRNFFMFIQDAPNKEKMVLGISKGKHFTIHLGTQSQVLDIHYTDESFPIGDIRRWRTLVRIPYDILEVLSHHIAIIMLQAMKTYFISQRINLGKLNHHNCYLVRMDNTEQELPGLMEVKNKKIKLGEGVAKEKFFALYLLPQDMPTVRTSNLYRVYQRKNGLHIPKGIIWYLPSMKGRKPFFVSMKNFNRMAATMRMEAYDKCKELGVFIDTELWDEIKG